MDGKIVCIEGNIGAGKSTALNELKKKGFYIFQEDLDDWGILLDRFYKDGKRWSFTLQVAILVNLHDRYPRIKELCKSYEFVFVERSPDSSLVFARHAYESGYMTPEEFKILKDIHKKLRWEPDFKIFLDTNIDICIENIRKRGRECEKNLAKKYLHNIAAGYNVIKFDDIIDASKTPKVSYEINDVMLSFKTPQEIANEMLQIARRISYEEAVQHRSPPTNETV